MNSNKSRGYKSTTFVIFGNSMLIKLYKLLFILLVLLANSYYAQVYHFQIFDAKKGLPNNKVKTIFQDSYGFIWMGTEGGGISRFDGKTFTNYDTQNGLVGNDVICIAEDTKHNIWIGTTEGASKFDRKQFTNYTTKNGLSNNVIYHILIDSSKVYFSTFGGGISVLENEKFNYVQDKNGLGSNEVFSTYKSKNKTLWIANNLGGITKYNGKTFSVIKQQFGFDARSACYFLETFESQVYIGTPGKGIYKKIADTAYSKLPIPEIETDYIQQLVEDKRRNIWASTEHGVLKYNPIKNKYQFFNTSNGLPSNEITGVCIDYEGNIWFSCFGYGVYKLSNEAVSVFDESYLQTSKTNAIVSVPIGTIISNEKGLFRYLNKQINKSSVLSANSYHSFNSSNATVYAGADGVVDVFSTDNNELKQVDKIILKQNNEAINSQVLNIVSSKDSSLWICAYGNGFYQYKKKTLKNFSLNTGNFEVNEVYTVCISKNNLYVGTDRNGIYEFNFQTHQYKNITKQLGVTSNSIRSIVTQNGRLIIGTNDAGVFICENNTTTQLNKNNGLSSNSIASVKCDEAGNIWIATQLDFAKITLNKDNTISTLKVFGEEEGVGSAGEGHDLIAFEGDDVLFSTLNGLVVYNQKLDVTTNVAPKLVLENIRLQFLPIEWGSIQHESSNELGLALNPIFNYEQNHLTFDFQALTSSAVQYSYKLEGSDKEWSPYSTNNSAIYPNLAPGSYVLKIKAKNKHGIESQEVTYAFIITPPFWQTWWFLSLSAITLIAGIGFVANYRTKRLQRENQVLESKVVERTTALQNANDHLHVALEEIKDSINYAKRIQSAILPELSTITEHLPNSFVLYQPRDVVSGDFYWFQHHSSNKLIIAAADCTGHGVPGAFMSMIGSSLLNEIVITKNSIEPSDILQQLNKGVHEALKQNQNQSKDGMDIALCVIDKEKHTLRFAGANRTLYLIREKQLIEYKPTKLAIGGFTSIDAEYLQTEITLQKGDTFYLSTDGYADQFGGKAGKKLLTKNFKDFLTKIALQPISQQQALLLDYFTSWKSDFEQVDDVLVIGFTPII